MAKGRLKITQMTPKGANLDPTDLLEISEDTGSGYVTRSITGQEIIDAASGGTQDLQSVTDNGATTDNAITITGAGDNQVYIDGNYVIAEDTVTNTSASLDSNGALLLNNAGNEESALKNSNVSNPGVILEFPNKATGSYTIATTSDLSSYVPYTGATGDVDLGTNQLDAKSVKINGTAGAGHLSLKHQSAGITAGGSESAIGANSAGDPVWKNDGNALDYIELQSNRKTNLTSNSDSYYPTVKAVKTAVDAKVSTSTTISINGTTQDLSANRTYTVNLSNLGDTTLTSIAKGNSLEYNGTSWVNVGIKYTIELMDALTVDFYAAYDLKINSVTNILNSPTTTILDDGVSYTLGNTIVSGSKITVTVNTAAVVTLNVNKV